MAKDSLYRAAKRMYKPGGNKSIKGMHRPEGAGNFDNMDDFNIVDSTNTNTGTIQHTPTNAKDLVNKEYVDTQFPVTHASTTGQTTDDHHAETHTILSHDTDTTGAELTSLADNSMVDTLHRHSELSASDGTPDAAVQVDATGNVGIGTATPTSLLHIKDDFPAGIAISIDRTENANVDNQFFIGSSYITDTSTDFMWLGTAVTTLAIKGDGNIGIGTTSPDGTLHVHTGTAGSVTAWANADDLVVESSGNGGISLLGPDTSDISLVFGSPTDSIGALVRWNHNADLMDVGTTNAGGELSLRSADGVEGIRIDSSQNVGIGTSAPSNLLNVEGDLSSPADGTINWIQTLETTITSGTGGDTYGVGIDFDLDNTAQAAGIAGLRTNSGITHDSALAFYTRAHATGLVEHMRIDEAGNVGIGTSTPAVKLSNTATRIANADGLSTALAGLNWEVNDQGFAVAISNLKTTAANHNAGLLVELASSDATDKILDLESGGVNRVRVLGNGNVGIGTTSPNEALTLGGDGVLSIDERASAPSNTAAFGKLWVKTATPNQLWFTDDAGTSTQIV